ncbi:MAG: hypothetical protein RKE49_13440 [Oceanicaulis sp.]
MADRTGERLRYACNWMIGVSVTFFGAAFVPLFLEGGFDVSDIVASLIFLVASGAFLYGALYMAGRLS